MAQVIEFAPVRTLGDFNLDAALGQPGDPTELFTENDQLKWVHIALGFGSAFFLPPMLALGASLLFVGYQLSQVSEAMASTSTEIFEFGMGVAAGALMKGAR
jgi:hypothetical protein